MHPGHGHPTRRRGITWVEIALAVGAISLVGVTGSFFFTSKAHATETDAAFRDAQRIRDAVVEWRSDNQEGCPTLSQLQQEHRLDRAAQTEDPWGQRFRVECGGSDISVVSAGRDGKSGTDDDVRVPKTRG
jgi:hypothetical protein